MRLKNSPFEYRAEQKGLKVLISIKETAEFIKLPINGLSTSQRKIDREPDEIVRDTAGFTGRPGSLAHG